MRVALKPILMIAVQICSCLCLRAGIDYMKCSEGQETPAYISQVNQQATGFVPYSKMFVRKDNLFCLTAPKNKESLKTCFTGLSKITVKPGMIYTLKLKAMGAEQQYLTIGGWLFKGDKCVEFLPILRQIFLQNVNGMTTITKDFAISPGIDSMILNVYLAPAQDTMSSGIRLVFEEFSVTEKEMMKSPSTELCGKNLLPDVNFASCELGEFKGIHKGNGKNAKHWSNVDAQIVEINGVKCLKIERTPQNYIYPFFTSITLPVNPQNYFIKASATVRGKGESISDCGGNVTGSRGITKTRSSVF